MVNCFLLLMTIIVGNQLCLHALDNNVIEDFLRFKSASKVDIFHCFNKRDKVTFMKSFSHNFMLRMFDLNSLHIARLDVFPEQKQKIGIIIDGINCPYEEVLDELSSFKAFTFSHPMLVALRNETLIESVFNTLVLTVSTDMQVITADYRVFDVYNPSTLHGGNLVWSKYPHWIDEERVFRRTNADNIYFIRRNLTGLVFKSMVVLPQPFSGTLEDYLHDDTNREVNSFNRFHATLMYHVSDYYDYKINMTKTNSWGFIQPNGSFDGVVRALELHQIDFGSSTLFVKKERINFVDYGRDTWLLRSAFLFRTPKRPASFQVFLRPLASMVWCLTIAASILIVLLLRLSLRSEQAEGVQEETENTFEVSWSHITLFTLGALCQQGSATSPNGISSRIAFIFIFIFTVLLYQYYSASIVAILVMTPAKFIRNLHDLAFSELTIGCENLKFFRDFFTKFDNDTVMGRMRRKSPTGEFDSFYVPAEVGMPRVAEGGFAFHVELATGYPIIEKTFDEDTICSLDAIDLYKETEHMAAQKGSPFLEMINHVLHKIAESGLLNRQRKHWHARRPECIRSQEPTTPVGMAEFYPALSLLLFGLILSLFILVVEHIFAIYKSHQRSEQKQTFSTGIKKEQPIAGIPRNSKIRKFSI